MSQPLVVHDSDVYVRSEFFTSYSGIHGLISVVVVSGCKQLLAEVVDGGVLFRESTRKSEQAQHEDG